MKNKQIPIKIHSHMKSLLRIARLIYSIKSTLDEIEKQNTEISMTKESNMLTIKRAAIYVGTTERAIKDLINEGELTFCRPTPNRTYIPKYTLDEYMRRNIVYSQYEQDVIAKRKCIKKG